jgi:hypothetical protein
MIHGATPFALRTCHQPNGQTDAFAIVVTQAGATHLPGLRPLRYARRSNAQTKVNRMVSANVWRVEWVAILPLDVTRMGGAFNLIQESQDPYIILPR